MYVTEIAVCETVTIAVTDERMTVDGVSWEYEPTIAVSETVIIEVTEEDLPPEETIGEDTPPETRSPSAENPPSSD